MSTNGINSIHIVGYLGQEVEVRKTASGKSVSTLSIATTHQEQTAWHRVVVWNQAADFAGNHIDVGDMVYVNGRLDYREYTDRNEQKRTSAEISCHTLQLLSKKDRSSTSRTGPPKDYPEADGNKSENGFDDIPF